MVSDGEDSVVEGRSDVHDGQLLILFILCFGIQIDPIPVILVPETWAEMNQTFVVSLIPRPLAAMVVSFPSHSQLW